MLTVPSAPHSLFKRRRKTHFPGSQESLQSSNSLVSSSSTFPLYQKSKDRLSFFQDGQERQVYLQLLQVASSPEAEFKNLDTVTPDIVNALDRSQGASPLHYACMNGNLPIINFLLENGADVNIWEAGKKVTPLICAAAHGHLEAVKLLLDHGCNIDDGLNGDQVGQHSAFLWAVRNNHSKVVEFLLEKGASQSSTDPFAETPIHAAVMCDSPEILRILISNLNQQDIKVKSNLEMGPEKKSPLHLAVSAKRKNSFELCKILLEEGNADANSPDGNWRTPLHGAVHCVELVNLLLGHNAMINAVDVEGKTPLFNAISEEDEAINSITALVKGGNCNVNHQDNHGNTPLHIAGLLKDTEAVEILLMHGADFSIKTDDGLSALSVLRKNIPTTHLLLKRIFDKAATLTDHRQGKKSKRQVKEYKVIVDYTRILPSFPSETDNQVGGDDLEMCERTGSSSSQYKNMEEIKQAPGISRKETSKINCLVDEGFSRLLVHPVIRSFLELKWRKAKIFYLPKLTFKILLVLLFTWYVMLLYIIISDYSDQKKREKEADQKNGSAETTDSGMGFCALDAHVNFLNGLHSVILIMALTNAFMELLEVLRSPKQQLTCMDPWSTLLVCYLIYDSRPPECEEHIRSYNLSRVAFSILLSWVDVWIDMGRFPTVGLSIRVFLKVLKKFLVFLLPHSTLLFGFGLALWLLFLSDKEFQGNVVTKLIRVMAGDVTMVSEEDKLWCKGTPSDEHEDIVDEDIRNYIFTAYVLIVAIVMMNLLIGLAVNDLREIYDDAATEVLLRQTVLVSTLETSLDGKWTRICFPNRFFAKYINLFSSKDSSNRSLSFNPHDSTDSKFSSEHKQALLSIASANRDNSRRRRRSCIIPYSPVKLLSQDWNLDALQKLKTRASAGDTDQLTELVESVNNLNATLLTYLDTRTATP